jgi:hypothetical protein
VARVVAFVPDLLFGSNVLGSLQAAGHDATLVSDVTGAELGGADVLVVDLTADAAERIARVQAGGAQGVPTLAFYSHVETDVRELAEQAGFELVVPRSRMAREGGALVSGLVLAVGE